MIPFQYTRATDVADAVRQIAGDRSARFIAGGTNLLDLMKDDVERPARPHRQPARDARPVRRARRRGERQF